jgi:hypothetical protein
VANLAGSIPPAAYSGRFFNPNNTSFNDLKQTNKLLNALTDQWNPQNSSLRQGNCLPNGGVLLYGDAENSYFLHSRSVQELANSDFFPQAIYDYIAGSDTQPITNSKFSVNNNYILIAYKSLNQNNVTQLAQAYNSKFFNNETVVKAEETVLRIPYQQFMADLLKDISAPSQWQQSLNQQQQRDPNREKLSGLDEELKELFSDQPPRSRDANGKPIISW